MDRTFFITSVTAQRRLLFRIEANARLLIDTILFYQSQEKFWLHEFVIMPDHFHALITPSPDISLERSVQHIKVGFSFRLHSPMRVWQPSFTNHRVRDAEDFVRHREYIWTNPVRAGIAAKAEGFPFSSACGSFKLDPMPLGLKPLLDWGGTPA